MPMCSADRGFLDVQAESNGPSPCPYRFVWSVRDKHMLSTVLDYNTDYAKGALPTDLPASFRHDNHCCPAALVLPCCHLGSRPYAAMHYGM